MKNLVQQRHLRRVCGRLIVSPTSQSDGREENEKEEPEEDANGRRKKSFQSEGSEENAAEEDGISNRHLSTTFIPPLTTGTKGVCPRRDQVRYNVASWRKLASSSKINLAPWAEAFF